MEFMLLFAEPRDAPDDPSRIAAMSDFAGKLAREGKLRRGAPLAAEADGVRIRVRGGKASMTDGPFLETKEVLGGFWVIETESREEAIEIARRCPHASYGIVEVHAILRRHLFADSEKGLPFLFAFRRESGLTDPDGAKMREMIQFAEALASQGKLMETTPLALDPPPARIETRGAKLHVTDGPFAETKEGVGGYSLIRATSRADAIDLAKRYPHATWGPVEVREILFCDEV